MTATAPRSMTFDVRPIESDDSSERWHWVVYEDPHSCFIRNGQVTGGRGKAERAARAAIAIMGGVVRLLEQEALRE